MESRTPRTRKPVNRFEFEYMRIPKMKRFTAKQKTKYQKKKQVKCMKTPLPVKNPITRLNATTCNDKKTIFNKNGNNDKVRIPAIAPRPVGEIAVNTANSNNSILQLNPTLAINTNENRGIIISKNSNGVFQLGFAAPTFEYSTPVGLSMPSTVMQPVLCLTNLYDRASQGILGGPFVTLPQQNSAIQVTPVPTPTPDSNTHPSPGLTIAEGSSVASSNDTTAISKSASPDHVAEKETVSSSNDPAEISKIQSDIPDDSSADDIMVVNECIQDNFKRKKNLEGDDLIKSRKKYKKKKTKSNMVKRRDTNSSAGDTNEFPSSGDNVDRKNSNSRGIEIAPEESASSHPEEDSSSSEKINSAAVHQPRSLSWLPRFAPSSGLPSVSGSDTNDSTDWTQRKCCIIGCGQERSPNGPSFHLFPKNSEVLRKWLDSIGTRLIFSSHPVVCGLHFEEECFVKAYNRKAFKTLKSGSIPTIFPTCSDTAADRANNISTTENDSRFVYDLQVKVEPPDDTDEYETVCENMFAAELAETPDRSGSDAEEVDDAFTLEDMSCPEKAKLYFKKMQKQQVLLKAQQEEQEQKITDQCAPLRIKEEVTIPSDDEDNSQEKKRQKRKAEPTKFQKNRYRALEDNPSPGVDEIEAYAVTVAAKLRKMSSQQRMFAENIINQILYKGLMNELSAGTQAIETQPFLSFQSQTVLPKVQQPQLFNVQSSPITCIQPSPRITIQQSPRINVEPSPNISVESSQKTSIQQSNKTSVQQSDKTSVQQSDKTSVQQSDKTSVQQSDKTGSQQSPIPSVQQSLSQPVQEAQLQNQQSQLSSIRSLPLTHPLVAMNIQTPQLHNSFQFQSQTLQDTYSAMLPIGTNRSLGPTIYTTHFSDPTIISNVPWKQSGTGGI